ncbi:hypothetical protein D9756_007832 [Leucocoprinus leucothites]|uniref:Meiotically up-regulated protein Msb1/Mug8 domain-containing protein n=1 Tax=Leucocoprinus leucothites TaxID=201217 RepID=A0A8H5D4L1_9AGAR|nr:hypothetical protein D9756_007832 [Leucoagaricus leucothites]
MPSFLSKVFGRKKDGKGSPPSRGRGSDGSLLEGKFEAISPVDSPSAAEFPNNAPKANGKERDGTFGLFKVKSRPSRSSSPEPNKKENLPQLSLVLPVPKEDAQTRALGVVFETDSDAQILTDDAIGKRTLTPLEALILIRTCSQAIVARGLETLGLMHPHWYSASPDVQRRLISLFIHSLNSNNAITTLSAASSSPTSIFESEINYTRSPHDVAAVLRWGLRHLELEGKKFGKDESWYKTFAEAERSSEYPPKSYSEKLTPLIPPAHLELLNTTLDLFSSLAAHAEKNSTSASKLTRAFGFWLLAAQRVGENDDWPKFYARWQDNGRILEHLFLARIRDESLRLRMPTRLTELVAQYPYVRGATAADDVFIQPRVSTRYSDALFVRIETEFSSPQDKVHRHPLQFLKDALAADVKVEDTELSALWEKIRNTGNDENEVSPGGYPGLSEVFAEETIRYLTLVPGNHALKKVTSPTFSTTQLSQETPISRRYASSPGPSSPEGTSASNQLQNGTTATTTNGHTKPASDPSPLPSAVSSSLSPDWTQFSSAGFSGASTPVPLASTLFGQDVEKTNPPFRKASRRSKLSSRSRSPSNTGHRKSSEANVTTPPRVSNSSQPSEPTTKLPSKAFPVSVVQIDEAFIEFWVDALLDPISSTWPKFVICKLRSSLADLTISDKRVQYLVVEHIFVPKPAPPPTETSPQSQPVVIPTSATEKPGVASSPRSSTKSEKQRFFGFFSSSGRHSFYGSPSSPSSKGKGKKVSPQARVSEMGEVIEDTDASKDNDKDKDGGKRKSSSSLTVKLRIPSPKPRKSADARKSVDVPKSPQQAVVEEEEQKEKKEGDDDVAIATAGAGASAAVAGAAAVALASAAAEDLEETKQGDLDEDKAAPTAAVAGAAEGSQFVENLLQPNPEETPKSEDGPATAAETTIEAEPQQQSTPAEEAALVPAEAAPISISNGHTLSAIAEKAESDPDATAAPPAPAEPDIAVATEAAVEHEESQVPEPEVSAPEQQPVEVAPSATTDHAPEVPAATPIVEEPEMTEAVEASVPVPEEPVIVDDTEQQPEPAPASESVQETPADVPAPLTAAEDEPIVEEQVAATKAPEVEADSPPALVVEEPKPEPEPVVEGAEETASEQVNVPAPVEEIVVAEEPVAEETVVEPSAPAVVEEPTASDEAVAEPVAKDVPALTAEEPVPVEESAPVIEEVLAHEETTTTPEQPQPATAVEEVTHVPHDVPTAEDSAGEVPPIEELEVPEEAAPVAAEVPTQDEPAAAEDHTVVEDNPLVEPFTSVEEPVAPAVDERTAAEEQVVEEPKAFPVGEPVTPVVEIPTGSTDTAAIAEESAEVEEAVPAPEPSVETTEEVAAPVEESAASAETEPTAFVAESSESVPAETVTETPATQVEETQAPIAEDVPDVQASEEVTASSHDDDKPVEAAPAAHEESVLETESTPANGNGHRATEPEKTGDDDVILPEAHAYTKDDTESTPAQAPTPEPTAPSAATPEKLSEIVVEDD